MAATHASLQALRGEGPQHWCQGPEGEQALLTGCCRAGKPSSEAAPCTLACTSELHWMLAQLLLASPRFPSRAWRHGAIPQATKRSNTESIAFPCPQAPNLCRSPADGDKMLAAHQGRAEGKPRAAAESCLHWHVVSRLGQVLHPSAWQRRGCSRDAQSQLAPTPLQGRAAGKELGTPEAASASGHTSAGLTPGWSSAQDTCQPPGCSLPLVIPKPIIFVIP